jgi:hypothetical protein
MLCAMPCAVGRAGVEGVPGGYPLTGSVRAAAEVTRPRPAAATSHGTPRRLPARSRPAAAPISSAPVAAKLVVWIQPPGPSARLLTGWRRQSYPRRRAPSTRNTAANPGPAAAPARNDILARPAGPDRSCLPIASQCLVRCANTPERQPVAGHRARKGPRRFGGTARSRDEHGVKSAPRRRSRRVAGRRPRWRRRSSLPRRSPVERIRCSPLSEDDHRHPYRPAVDRCRPISPRCARASRRRRPRRRGP